MMKDFKLQVLLVCFVLFAFISVSAQNPIIHDQFSADPTARVFGDSVYVYPSHDILAREGRGKVGWFCMADYHVFSSADLTNWIDHGVIVNQNKINWVDSNAFSMWAPDCIAKNGKYYFYFPSIPKDSSYGRGFSFGVAIADNPSGPFIPEHRPIKDLHGIDPALFIDKDGQSYIYCSARGLIAAKLDDNMLEISSKPEHILDFPKAGLIEGPFLFERNGFYYMTYPHVENKIERLEYAMSNNPLGPFKFAGVLMDESSTGCWTNHQSVIEFKGQWYLFYHHNDYSPNFDKNRSTRIDSLFFNADGTIRKVIPTLRGVGLTKASQNVQIDRYSKICDAGASIDFHDTLNRFDGWKTILDKPNAWIQYNGVDFGEKKYASVVVRCMSAEGGVLQIKLNNANGPVIAEVKIPKSSEWKSVKTPLSNYVPGVQNLVVQLKDAKPVEVDWVKFE